MGNSESRLEPVQFPANRPGARAKPTGSASQPQPQSQSQQFQQQPPFAAEVAVDAACDACSEAPGAAGDQAYVPGIESRRVAQDGAGCTAYMHSGCKLNRRELGRAAWGYLHTMAAYYPERPTPRQQENMRTYLELTAEMYPCTECAKRSVEEIERHPPRVESRDALAEWMCGFHNEVNERLGAPMFQCSDYLQRWRHQSCDEPFVERQQPQQDSSSKP